MNRTELESMTLSELRALAKERAIPTFNKYKKSELAEFLSKDENPPAKKRGRSPKAPAEDALSVADKTPKRRGRPPKAKEPTVQAEPVFEAPAKAESPEKPTESLPTEAPKAAPVAGAQKPEAPSEESTKPAQNERSQRPYYRQNGQYLSQSYNNNRYQNNRNYQPRNDGEHRPYRSNNTDNRPRREPRENQTTNEYGTTNPAVPELLQAPECRSVAGVLEVMEGYGFLRVENYYAGPNDVYVAIAQMRRFALKMGDYVEGRTRPRREGDKFEALLYIDRVNGMDPDENAKRKNFDELIPIFPTERYTLETPGRVNNLAVRLIDLIAPIGKGQRAMIVAQPKAGKTTLLKQIANGITENYPETHLIVLLVDERPEEVTDMRRSIRGEVVASTFDELPEHHTRIAEMVQERAMRLVENGRDVVILLDSLTRLTRAYNLVIPPTGRTLSGGMDPGALHKPKRFFGAARNIEGGGSLTVVATALVETGSRMDDIVYEEFKGTGNMEIHLDRRMSEKRIFPAIDIYKSGTRRDDLLLSKQELEGVYMLRKVLVGGAAGDVTEQVISMMSKTPRNEDFLVRLREWVRIYEKDGYSSGNGQNRYGQ